MEIDGVRETGKNPLAKGVESMRFRFVKGYFAFLVAIFLAIGVLFSGYGISYAADENLAKADMVLTNGVVYTVDENDTIAEAVAIKDGKIVFVGSSNDVKAYIGTGTEVIDLEGKMVLPGLMDTHLHSPGTALTELYNINLYGVLTEDETMKVIEQFIEEHPDLDMYYGSGFSVAAFSGEEVSIGPRKERLDAICPDKPVIITSYDGHITWVNSKALEEFGIDKNTPNPPGGVIERDPETGEPWGVLKESAEQLVPAQEFTLEQQVEALKLFQDNLHRLGYTGILSISGGSPVPFDAFKALEEQGELKLRVRSSMTMDPELELAPQFEQLKKLRDTYNSDLMKVTTAKYFADGVIEGVTGYLLEPYEAEAGKGDDYRGEFLWDMDKLKEAFRITNSEGFQIHVHSIGDASTRNVLDALEYAKAHAPEGDYRNTITHLQLVAPEDIPRFKELDVVASTQPYWHLKEPEWWEIVDYPFLGERAEYEYPLQSFIKEGVIVASSSDHPVTTPPNPFWAIEAGVTRNLNNAEYYGVEDIQHMDDPKWLLNKEERASLKDMIRSFTSNGAYVTFQENEIGTIEAGKYADLVVLDQNLFEIDPIQIDSVNVLKTIFNGEIVYDASLENSDESVVSD